MTGFVNGKCDFRPHRIGPLTDAKKFGADVYVGHHYQIWC